MTAATDPGSRIETLDIVRGFAVMGILAMNIVAFAMPFHAYLNPTAYGNESSADLASWAFSFVLIDGKMRGLFTFLFGASLLLVVERAEAGGRSPANVHYRRMIWLLLFGLIHFYFIWFGDILTAYALIGMLAFLFRKLSVRALIWWGVGFSVVGFLLMASLAGSAFYLESAVAAGSATPEMITGHRELESEWGRASAAGVAEQMRLKLGPWIGVVRHQLGENGDEPFLSQVFLGWETLSYMLFGMAALKSGFLKGVWEAERYRKYVTVGLGVGLPAYAALAWLAWSGGFDATEMTTAFLAGPSIFRPFLIVAYAALIVLLARSGGALIARVGAAGRAAFTNYLGTSLIMTAVFYGWGGALYGSLGRIELWLAVLPMWALMLLWSKPWLDRYRYGPFEWLWRSLARWRIEPMRREAAPPPA